MSTTDPSSLLKTLCAQRGLGFDSRVEVPALTPLLEMGDEQNTIAMAEGSLSDGLDGQVAIWEYIETDDDGPDTHVPFTVGLVTVEEVTAFAPRVLCYAKDTGLGSSFGFLDTMLADDTSTLPDRKVSLESELFHKRYLLKVDHDMGENWVRQLFSPSFIAWLADRAPKDLCFELVDGALCVFRPGHPSSEDEMTSFCDAVAEVATRMRSEALEEEGREEAGIMAMADKPEESLEGRTERAAAREHFPSGPPADVATASRAYRSQAILRWQPWVGGVGSFVAIFVVGALIALAEDGRGYLMIVASPFIGGGIWWSFVSDYAKRLGKAAFAREYAEANGLDLQRPRRWQARNMRLRLPGPVEFALQGPVLGPGTDDTLVFMRSRPGTGEEKTKRVDYNGLVLEFGSDTAIPEGGQIDGNGSLTLVSHGRVACIYGKSAGESERSLAEIATFLQNAGGQLEKLKRGELKLVTDAESDAGDGPKAGTPAGPEPSAEEVPSPSPVQAPPAPPGVEHGGPVPQPGEGGSGQ